ncbi:hypothetical protein [Anatilimnocola floriformis]|uniref:hypothetical protein n=1 Tax=Anatilimnocola floriformis TaxID=2948575 RepID=UPI0020C50E23|nr:hypothetical protein [Anatilimnocola floriformis]
MSNRTWVCLKCCKSQRRPQALTELKCPHCQEPCEPLNWKIRIPSPKNKREWKAFWEQILAEKALLAEFERNPSIKELKLDLPRRIYRRD